MAQAQAAADKESANLLEDYKRGVTLGREGDAAFKAGRFASAARDYMRARQRFQRVLR
jgi:hypothetical protein